MPDFAGAKAAIRARLEAGWSSTLITYQNENPPWGENGPQRDNGSPAPWVNLEIIGEGSSIWTFGVPGNRGWRYPGEIHVHVFVPVGEGDAQATEYAVAIGELFRAAKFYDDDAGCYVRTLSPQVDGGGSGDDDGKWFRVSMTVDFNYWHRG